MSRLPDAKRRARPRPVYRRAELIRLLAPTSIAVVGASPNPDSFAGRTVGNLAGYHGRLWRVNSRYERIGEAPCYPSLQALPEPPDCVVVAIAKERVEPVIDEALAVGAGGVIVFASGYAETGKPEDIALQQRLASRVTGSSLRLIGPNCIGIANVPLGLSASFMFTPRFIAPTRPALGLVSQSGALGFALAQASERGVAFSHLLTAGNSVDVDVADEVAYLAEDPACSAIVCLFEGMADPSRMFEAADLARAAGKPLVMYKIASGEQGAAAALSHTGSLAGSRAAWSAAFDRHGIIEVDSFEALLETATFFAKAPAVPAADGVAVIATSGGAAIIAADVAERHGVPLPQPADEVAAILAAEIPDFGSARNPCDVTAQVLNSPESLRRCASALLGDPAFCLLLYPAVYANDAVAARQSVFDQLARDSGKLVLMIWMTQWYEGTGAAEAERLDNVVTFQSMDRALAAVAAWQRRARRSARLADGSLPWVAEASARQAVAGELAAAGTSETHSEREADSEHEALTEREVLTEREAKALLARYGVPVVGERLATTREEAMAAAVELGLPVAMKIESPDIAHKTEAGGVMLGLADPPAVGEAFDRILANAASHAPRARLSGVLVQPMAPKGVEMLIGARVDPQFGPLIVVGLGGVLVELMKDSALALAPVSVSEASLMIDALAGRALLDGFRGAAPVDRAALATLVARVSTFIADHRDRIEEIDLNPVICHAGGLIAVDALIRLRKPAAADTDG